MSPPMGVQAQALDAIILCGDKGASRMVEGESKAFLFMHGKPLFIRAATAAAQVERVGRIFIIGDKTKLDYYVSRFKGTLPNKPITTLEQDGSLLENIWAGFIGSIDGYQQGMENTDLAIKEKVVLLMPGDTPLISPAEINQFLDGADMEKFDYAAGMTQEAVMARYYPAQGKPGIKMAYLHFKEGRFRINNLHLARPFACRNREVIQLMYNSRYQKDIRNILRLTRDMWTHHAKTQTLVLYARLQAAMFMSFAGFGRTSDWLRRGVTMRAVAEAVGGILGMRVCWSETSRGGAALDVDNDIDYETMKIMFRQWEEAHK
ncbi:MAG: nucleotidyltransferase family protein [Nitrospinota bacterium]|nr:nucleotidyltransferase family protein [Nitrospinota bacterium]